MSFTSWEKRFFSNSYHFFYSDLPFGYFKIKSFKNKSVGELNNKAFLFENIGFWKKETRIIEVLSNDRLANIKYDLWKDKALIEYAGKTFQFKYDNLWRTKWSILLDGEPQVSYKASITHTKGKVFSSNAAELLILAGIYISNIHSQKAVFVSP